MKNKLFNGVLLLLGTLSGFYLGWISAKRKYENLANDEVDSVKKSLKNYYESESYQELRAIELQKEKDPQATPEEKAAYIDYSKPYQGTDKPLDVVKVEISEKEYKDERSPYTISPEEFKDSTYETKTLMYYADKVLADDDYNILDDIRGCIGEDALGEFGKYEDDAVYVRNDQQGIDYEILLDERSYYKITTKRRPVSGGDHHDEDDE